MEENFFISKKGQSAIEYIMLIAVIGVLALSVFNSARFKEFVGTDSTFFQAIKEQMEYSYRQGKEGLSSKDSSEYNLRHELYYDVERSQSRFFSSLEPYPEE